MTKTPPVGRTVVVEVPATTANLGPGFDTLGMALTIQDRLSATVMDTPGVVVDVHGVGEGEVPTDETNLIARSMAHAFASKKIPMPGIHLEAHNVIPHGRGLGSSGAAIVSGVMAAKGLLEGIAEFSASELLALATDMEGHPDNIAPSLFGGLTIAWMTDEGPKHKKLSVHRGVSLVVAVPEDSSMSTQLARSLQPETVPHQDAIFNLSRSALLIAALIQSPELLFEATEDRLHQNYRASAMKDTDALLQSLRAKGYAAVVSGAGPSVLILCPDPGQRLDIAQVVEAHPGGTWTSHMLTVDERGATVEEVPALAD
ncbi:homoserine kinase [Pontimonas sp.]|nr:homoserine kinase [Pontimonas sp.]MDA8887401.1 homoserine kinase [Pontimonas sp.]